MKFNFHAILFHLPLFSHFPLHHLSWYMGFQKMCWPEKNHILVFYCMASQLSKSSNYCHSNNRVAPLLYGFANYSPATPLIISIESKDMIWKIFNTLSWLPLWTISFEDKKHELINLRSPIFFLENIFWRRRKNRNPPEISYPTAEVETSVTQTYQCVLAATKT